MKKLLIKIILVLVVLAIIGVVVAILCLDSIVKKGVETAGPMITQVDVKLEHASVSLVGGSAKLKGFFVGNPTGYKTDSAIKVGNVAVSLKPKSILSDKIIIESINVQAPEITVEGTPTKNNLTKIQENVNGVASSGEAAQKKPGDSKPAKKLQVTDLVISGAKVHFNSTLTLGKTMTLSIPDIHLTNLGTGSDGITPAELTKKVLDELMQRIIPALIEAASHLGKDATKVLGEEGKKNVESVTKGLKGLLKK